jgi:hypothetical protein
MLKCYRDIVGSGQSSGSKIFVLHLPEYVPTDHEESVLWNFTIVNPLFNIDIICAVESVIPKLPPIFGMEF